MATGRKIHYMFGFNWHLFDDRKYSNYRCGKLDRNKTDKRVSTKKVRTSLKRYNKKLISNFFKENNIF